MSSVDLLIVGAGPAGMAAAVAARAFGLDVMVVDDQPSPGGQIFRGVETVPAPRATILGRVLSRGSAARRSVSRQRRALRARRASSGRSSPASAPSSAATTRRRRSYGQSRHAGDRRAGAAGAVSGLDAAGRADRRRRADPAEELADEIPDKPVWIAGCGPLPLLYMTQLLRGRRQDRRLSRHDTAAAGCAQRCRICQEPCAPPAISCKGLSWTLALRRAGVPIIRHVIDLEADGQRTSSKPCAIAPPIGRRGDRARRRPAGA